MKAAAYTALGSPEHLTLVDLPAPVAREGELLVRVRASSVNPIDWKIAAGTFPFNLLKPPMPYVPGFDVAGEVLTGHGDFKPGDRVFARMPGQRGGASAERAAFEASVAVKIPEGMSDDDAAAVPLAGLTALQGLCNEGGLTRTGAEGKRVLVVGASGGVGHFGVQIAKAAGAHVTGVCSARNVDLVRSLGDDDVVDYGATQVFNAGGDYDVILDCVGSDAPTRFTPWLRAKGTYVSCLPNASVFGRQALGALGLGARVRGVMMRSVADDLRWLATLWERRQLRVVIDEVFPLARAADAHRRSISGRARGKVVVHVE